jgi:beta-hydroxylase
MIIHSYVYNQNKIILPQYNNYMIWDYKTILDLIKNKYSEFEVYFKRLILNKSRENFVKYIVIAEFGGIFVNIELLKLFANDDISLIINYNSGTKSKYDMVFWMENSQKDLTKDIFEIDEFILNDDIFIIKNNSNTFVCNLIQQIDKTIIPSNEYENKIYLGNIFLSKQLSTFYQSNFGIKLTNNNSWFGFVEGLESHYKNNSTNKFEKAIYFIELNKIYPFNIKYKLKTYPNVPDLSNPEKILNSWDMFYRIKNYVENMIILIIFQNNTLFVTMILICLIVIINYLFKEYLKANLNIQIKPAQIDSKVFFNPKKFKFFKELKKYWRDIRDEALSVMINSKKLDISRTIDDWHGAEKYFKSIQNKEGWIRSWAYDPEGTVHDQTQEGNYEWLNYGLLYFGEEFTENIKMCPKTFELVNKIKSHINICGFSWMFGGCLLQPHTDITGLSSGTLAMHLGLSVPKPDNTCRLIIKNENDEYMYMNEENGKMFIFDATWEHYAYNLTNEDRLILYVDFKTM